MKLFVSYTSEDRNKAEQIALALGSMHRVFFDRDALPPGGDFNARIRAAIMDVDGMIFLISPESVQPGSYTLTELELAKDRWGHPLGRILPVMVRATDFHAIPNFLKAVTILETKGNLAAEVVAAIDKIWSPHPVISGLSGFAHLVGASAKDLQATSRTRRKEIAQYLDEIYHLLIDAHKVLEQGEIPHGTCAEILQAGERLIKTIGDAVDQDDIAALKEQLSTAYRVEYLLVDISDPHERALTLAELERASGTFHAIARALGASPAGG